MNRILFLGVIFLYSCTSEQEQRKAIESGIASRFRLCSAYEAKLKEVEDKVARYDDYKPFYRDKYRNEYDGFDKIIIQSKSLLNRISAIINDCVNKAGGWKQQELGELVDPSVKVALDLNELKRDISQFLTGSQGIVNLRNHQNFDTTSLTFIMKKKLTLLDVSAENGVLLHLSNLLDLKLNYLAVTIEFLNDQASKIGGREYCYDIINPILVLDKRVYEPGAVIKGTVYENAYASLIKPRIEFEDGEVLNISSERTVIKSTVPKERSAGNYRLNVKMLLPKPGGGDTIFHISADYQVK